MDMNLQAVVPAKFTDIDVVQPDAAIVSAVEAVAHDASLVPAEPASMKAIHDVPVKVQAVLGGAKITIDDLLNTRAGTVIELDRRVGEPVDVVVNGRLLARGELVMIDGVLGLTLTEIVKTER